MKYKVEKRGNNSIVVVSGFQDEGEAKQCAIMMEIGSTIGKVSLVSNETQLKILKYLQKTIKV